MKKKSIANKYFQSTELSIVGLLKPGDYIYTIREMFIDHSKPLVKKKVKHIVQFDPVLFKYSGNWTVRTSMTLSDTREILTEYLYINESSLDKYWFPVRCCAIIASEQQEYNFKAFLKTLSTNEEDIHEAFVFKA